MHSPSSTRQYFHFQKLLENTASQLENGLCCATQYCSHCEQILNCSGSNAKFPINASKVLNIFISFRRNLFHFPNILQSMRSQLSTPKIKYTSFNKMYLHNGYNLYQFVILTRKPLWLFIQLLFGMEIVGKDINDMVTT